MIENDSIRKLEALRKDNRRKLQELNAECQIFEIEMKEMEDVQRGENMVCTLLVFVYINFASIFQVRETQRRAAAETRITKARGDKDVAESQVRLNRIISTLRTLIFLQGQREAEELIRSTTIKCNAMKIKADQDYATMVTESKSRLAAARNTAEGMCIYSAYTC